MQFVKRFGAEDNLPLGGSDRRIAPLAGRRPAIHVALWVNWHGDRRGLLLLFDCHAVFRVGPKLLQQATIDTVQHI
jgi:type IV secretory pathway TrbD component